jgi:hypothetical protein
MSFHKSPGFERRAAQEMLDLAPSVETVSPITKYAGGQYNAELFSLCPRSWDFPFYILYWRS